MAVNLKVYTEDFGGSDKSWIRTRHGLADMLPVMIDISAFNANNVVNGKIPSGTALGKITASGLYGPYAGTLNEIQSITVDATGGTYTITAFGQATAAISATATAAAVQAALELNDDIDVGDVTVTGGPGNAGGTTPYFIEFKGQYAGTNVAQVTTTTSLTGGATTAAVATTQAGGSASTDGTEVFAGFLFEDYKVNSGPNVTPAVASAADGAAALFHMGIVIASKLPTFSGTNIGELDTNGRLANPRIVYV